MRPATLLYVANVRLPTDKAYGIQIANMCAAFAEQGVCVDMVVPTRRNPISDDFFAYYGIPGSFRIVRMYSPDFYFPGGLDRIAVRIKDALSAAVLAVYVLTKSHAHIYSRDELPLYLLSFFRKNLVFEAHKYSLRRRRYYKRFMRAGVRVIAISDGVREEFLKLGYAPERVMVAPDGVNLGRFNIQKTKQECRELLGLPQEKVLVMYTGHLYEWKGAAVLADAARHLDERFVIVFVGGTENDISRYQKQYGGSDRIRLLGWRSHREIPLYLKAADVVVLPNSAKEDISRKYTSPLKMFEYMASGRPIVASDLPSIREILTADMAFFVRPDDPRALAMTITEAVYSEEADRRARLALQKVAQFSWRTRAGRIIEFFTHD